MIKLKVDNKEELTHLCSFQAVEPPVVWTEWAAGKNKHAEIIYTAMYTCVHVCMFETLMKGSLPDNFIW